MDNPRNNLGNNDALNQYKKQQPAPNANNSQRSAYNQQGTQRSAAPSAPVARQGQPARPSAGQPSSRQAANQGQRPAPSQNAKKPSVADAQKKGAKGKKQPEKRPPRKLPPSEMTPEMIRAQKKKEAKKKMFLRNFGRVSIIMAIVIAIAASIASVAISCVNDVFVIHVPEKKDVSASVVITEGMNTYEVIDVLDDAGLLKNGWFCKIAADFIGYSDDGYIARTYDLRRSMGLENMLNEIKNKTSKTAKTVKLTFPEGYNADQIIEMLEENNVCTRSEFVQTMNTVDFSADFEFLATMSNVENRYMRLEGYLFPDTYEFYIGEDPTSVIKKFLSNFSNKWTADYAEQAQELRLTVDQVIKLAAIVEKEAVGEDMPVVGSILHNRLDAGMRLECDSTSSYISSNKSGLSQDQVEALDALYDTYICSGMPAGAICNPGIDSIKAILFAPDTDYYYFIHDANNEFHVAKTLAEQEYNIATYGLAE